MDELGETLLKNAGEPDVKRGDGKIMAGGGSLFS
jgi:hypothetical protein